MRTITGIISVLSISLLGGQAARADSPHELVNRLQHEAHKVADYSDRVITFVPQARSIHDSALAMCDRADALLTPQGVDGAQLQAIYSMYSAMRHQAEYWEEATDDWNDDRHYRCTVSGNVLGGDDLEDRFDDVYEAVDDLGDTIDDLRDVGVAHGHQGHRGHADQFGSDGYGRQAAPRESYYRNNGGQQIDPRSYNDDYRYQQPTQLPSSRGHWTDYVRMFMDSRR